MSVITWDGKTIAADKRAVCAGAASTTTKLRRISTGEVLGWTGDQAAGEYMAQWYESGADPAKWPKFQEDKEDWCRLVIADRYGAKFFERRPIASKVEDKFCAWGSGRDYALAAMFCGKTAAEAVEITCMFCTECGNGIDIFELRPALEQVHVG